MFEPEKTVGDEFQTFESHNILTINNDDNFMSDNKFDEMTQLVTTTSNEYRGPPVGHPNDWTSSFGDEKEGGVGGSIAERRAVTCGFNVGGFNSPTINIARFRSNSPISSPVIRSPYITIPAGISPTELLDSPMLRYSQSLELQNKFQMGIDSDTKLSADFKDSKMSLDHLASQSCFEVASSSSGFSKTSEDGYNWRKYGQKQVKGSEFPRSYYKCTHPNCLVKKKVERSHDGDVAEIIYKGSHTHPLPQTNPRSNVGASFSENFGFNEQCGDDESGGGVVWRNIQPRVEFKNVMSENLDPYSTAQMKSSEGYEVMGTHENSCKIVCREEDGNPSDGKPLEDDTFVDESESKRRKIELPFPETNVASRGVREARMVVQIESEVDILDDGYRWRKYGQKVVKGNPNPRSYYKCTSPGCPVRKHVERACDDYKFVITTYEGKHDHEVPLAKTTTVSSSGLSPAATQPAYAQSRPTLKVEPQMQDLSRRFEKIPDFGNDFMRSALIGNFGADLYPLNFPHLQNPMGSYGYSGMSNFPMSLLYGVPRPPMMMMPGNVDIYNLPAPAQSSVVGQQPNENDLGLIKPKQEREKLSPQKKMY